MRYIYLAAALTAAIQAGPATSATQPSDRASPAAATTSSGTLTAGEVRKIDTEAKKITIRHGPMENLGMPAMTMVFRVENPTLLGGIKAGDKIQFRAENLRGAYTVTRIERQ